MPSLQLAPPQQQQQPQAQFTNQANWYSAQHYPQPDMARRQQEQGHFAPYGAQPPAQPGQPQHHAAPVQPAMAHAQQAQATASPLQQQQQTPTQAPALTPRQRKRPAPSQQGAHPPAAHAQQHPQQHPQHPQHPQHLQQQQQQHQAATSAAQVHPGASAVAPAPVSQTPIQPPTAGAPAPAVPAATPTAPAPTDDSSAANPPPTKKSRTNTPWSPAEELRLKQMRDAGNSWAEIAKVRDQSWKPCIEPSRSSANISPDLPDPYRGQCQEALVQGYALC